MRQVYVHSCLLWKSVHSFTMAWCGRHRGTEGDIEHCPKAVMRKNSHWLALIGLILCVLGRRCFSEHQENSDTLSSGSKTEYHDYVVVGGGPAGLQHSWYLHTAGHDYVTLEKSGEPGGSFRKVPRWRKLISINKVHLERDELDFNLRHDWNSLLSDPSHMMTRQLPEQPEIVKQRLFDLLNNTLIQSSQDFSGNQKQFDGDSFRQKVSLCCTEAVSRLANHNRSMATRKDDPCSDVPYLMTGCLSASDTRLNVSQTPPGLLMRHFTHEYYPHADNLVKYLDSFQRRTSLNVLFNTTVTSIGRTQQVPPESSENGVNYRYRVEVSSGISYSCKYLIIALGITKPNPPDIFAGHEHLYTYDNAPTDLDSYKGKKVLIVGRGNGAFEFADNVMEVTAYVHLLGGIHRRLRLAWESHYPGDIRAIHNKVLESYQLKTLDALMEGPLNGVLFEKLDEADIIEYRRKQQIPFPETQTSSILSQVASSEEVETALRATLSLEELTYQKLSASNSKAHSKLWGALHYSGTLAHTTDGFFRQNLRDNFSIPSNETQRASSVRSRPLKRINQRHEIVGRYMFDYPENEDGLFYQHPRSVYDIVIACLGWKFDTSLFNDSAVPVLTKGEKYPIITPGYESVNNEGMYFVGAASHSIDAGVAAGGFIHGYRYTSRASHRMHEETKSIFPDELRTSWPFHILQTCSNSANEERLGLIDRLVTRIQSRLNHASGIYQMFNGYLQDVIIYEPVEHAHLRPRKYASCDNTDDDVSLPWFDSGDPVEYATRGWIDGIMSKSENISGIKAFYFEEIPIHAVPYLVRRWVYRLFSRPLLDRGICDEVTDWKRSMDCILDFYNGIRYSTIYLEYSHELSVADGTRDPFMTERVTGSRDRPQDSGFLHPRMRTYDSRIEDEEGFTTLELEKLQQKGVRSPQKFNSPSHVEDNRTSVEEDAKFDAYYGERDVTSRSDSVSEAIMEDFSAEFYTYWKATRPLQRFLLESFRRHALVCALSVKSKRDRYQVIGDDFILEGVGQVLLAHDVDSQFYLLRHPEKLRTHSLSNQSRIFFDKGASALWPCTGSSAVAFRKRFFGFAPGFSRRRSRRDFTRITNSLYGVTLVLSGSGGMTSDIFPLTRHLSERLPELVIHLITCDDFSASQPPFRQMTNQSTNETLVQVWLSTHPTLVVNMENLEVDVPQFYCDQSESIFLSCGEHCSYKWFSNFVDSQVEEIEENPQNQDILDALIVPAADYLRTNCLSEEIYSDVL